MFIYYQVSSRVAVNCHSDMYIHGTTLKLFVHLDPIVWSTHVQREVLYTYKNVVTVLATKCVIEDI